MAISYNLRFHFIRKLLIHFQQLKLKYLSLIFWNQCNLGIYFFISLIFFTFQLSWLSLIYVRNVLHYTLCYQYDFEGCDYAFKAILIFFLHLISYSVRNKCICIHKPYDISITIELHLANNFIPNKRKKKEKNKVKKNTTSLKKSTIKNT